ncbi:hypothetical protein J6X96_08295 [bacterium]|nr:hypothetical protein [bacterium]
MKKLICLLLIFCSPLLASNIEQVVAEDESGEHNGLLNGFVSILTCYLEVPRAFTYEATARPRSMIVLAPVLGSCLTGIRALVGTGNVLTLGFCDKFIRGDIPEYIWDAYWIAPRPESD